MNQHHSKNHYRFIMDIPIQWKYAFVFFGLFLVWILRIQPVHNQGLIGKWANLDGTTTVEYKANGTSLWYAPGYSSENLMGTYSLEDRNHMVESINYCLEDDKWVPYPLHSTEPSSTLSRATFRIDESGNRLVFWLKGQNIIRKFKRVK